MCSPAHPLNSAPSTMSEVTGPRSVLCLGGGSGGCSALGRTRLSQRQTGGDSGLVGCGSACSGGLGEGCQDAEALGLTHVPHLGPLRCH